jgi:guanine deaminase
MSGAQLFRATLFHTPTNPFREEGALRSYIDGGLLVRGGRIVANGDFDDVRRADPDAAVVDWRGGMLLPGFVDAHVHYPQLPIIGRLGRTLLDWLQQVALPEEARMADQAYANERARRFVAALATHGTTTALVFGAHFAAATAALFEAAEETGLRVISGLVLSDRFLPPPLLQSVERAYRDSNELIRRFHGRGRLLYAVTPRFALSTSDAMLEMCQTLLREHEGLRTQSHVNESPDEIRMVAERFPWAADYVSVYDRFELTGAHAVLAHNVHTTGRELERLAATRTAIAHCPTSNAALGSGIFPLRRHLEAGVHVALGTDVGGGTGLGMLKEGLQAYLMQRVAADGAMLDAARLLYLSVGRR